MTLREAGVALFPRPKSLVLSYVFELPFGRNKHFGANMNKVVNGVLGGWQFALVS